MVIRKFRFTAFQPTKQLGNLNLNGSNSKQGFFPNNKKPIKRSFTLQRIMTPDQPGSEGAGTQNFRIVVRFTTLKIWGISFQMTFGSLFPLRPLATWSLSSSWQSFPIWGRTPHTHRWWMIRMKMEEEVFWRFHQRKNSEDIHLFNRTGIPSPFPPLTDGVLLNT